MKTINELTEQEIFALTDPEIQTMIKFRKLEEGIKLISEPIRPEYLEAPKPDKIIYQCNFLSSALVFENIDELKALLDVVRKSNCYKMEYGVNSTNFLKRGLGYYPEKWDEISSASVYSAELYSQIKDIISNNEMMKKKYDTEYKEYNEVLSASQWIEDEINNRVFEVQDKFYKLRDYCQKFRLDYLPLSDDNKAVALAFMDKAFSLSDEQKAYILENYDNGTN